jgi:hypothetical protein
MLVDYAPDGRPRVLSAPATWRYWLVSSLLMLWGLGYAALVAEAFFIFRPEDFDRLVSAGMILPGYSNYVQELPRWIIALSMVKAATRLGGSICLLLRRRWAVSFYSLSLAISCLIFFRGFLLDDRASLEGSTQIGLDVAFFALSVYAVYFAFAARFRGTLR